MAGIAALANVNIAARKLQWRIDAHIGCVFHGLVNGEKRRDFHDAADARHDDDTEHEADGFAFQPIVQSEHMAHSPG